MNNAVSFTLHLLYPSWHTGCSAALGGLIDGHLPSVSLLEKGYPLFDLFLFFVCLFCFLFERERERGRGRERESQAGSTLSTEPYARLNVGLDLTTLGSRPEPKLRVRCSTNGATQAPLSPLWFVSNPHRADRQDFDIPFLAEGKANQGKKGIGNGPMPLALRTKWAGRLLWTP